MYQVPQLGSFKYRLANCYKTIQLIVSNLIIRANLWYFISDKECPLFNKSIDDVNCASTTSMDPSVLIRQMEEEGLSLKKNVSSEQRQNNTVINMYGKVRIGVVF